MFFSVFHIFQYYFCAFFILYICTGIYYETKEVKRIAFFFIFDIIRIKESRHPRYFFCIKQLFPDKRA